MRRVADVNGNATRAKAIFVKIHEVTTWKFVCSFLVQRILSYECFIALEAMQHPANVLYHC